MVVVVVVVGGMCRDAEVRRNAVHAQRLAYFCEASLLAKDSRSADMRGKTAIVARVARMLRRLLWMVLTRWNLSRSKLSSWPRALVFLRIPSTTCVHASAPVWHARIRTMHTRCATPQQSAQRV